MLETIKYYRFQILVALGAGGILLLFIIIFLTRQPTITRTLQGVKPNNNQGRVQLKPVIEATFNETLQNQKYSFTLSPTVDGETTRVNNGKSVRFTPSSQLDPLTIYTATITLNTPFNTPDKTIQSTYEWSFTTDQEFYGEEALEANPTAAAEFRQIMQEAENTYTARKRRMPFITQLPFQTNHFLIEISPINDTVTITTYGNSSQEHLSYREEALNWIRSNGGNMQNFTIVYNPTSP